MPFSPEELEFHRGERSKLVDFHDSTNGASPWTVNRARIAGYSVQRSRWRFENVGPHPDPEKSDSWMQGTLTFDTTALDEGGDSWLATNWPTSGDGAATLEMSVGCNSQPRPLTIKLKA